MQILPPDQSNDDEIKIGRLEADAEIYNSKRIDPTASERWKMMTKAEKKQYFKDYYLKFTIIGVIVLIISSYIIYTLVKPPKKDEFYVALFNTYVSHDDEDNFQKDFGSYLGDKVDQDRIFLKSYQDSFLSEIEVDSFFEKRRYDVFITNENRFKTFAKTDNYAVLSDVLPKDLYNKLNDKILLSNDTKLKDKVKQYPFGISLKDSKYTFYDEYGNKIEDPVLGIVGNSKRMKRSVQFIKYLFE